jgi:catechol 2,3-dioxygenase-like lactoylglutathione lyase family enzyme
MRIEHIAMIVQDPPAVAAWYVQHLGMRVVRAGGPPTHTTFLADKGDHVMVEIYTNPSLPVPDYRNMDPLILHLAFKLDDDMAEEHARLLAAGCTPAGEIGVTPAGDQLAMLRDPWGFAIQLAHRQKPML